MTFPHCYPSGQPQGAELLRLPLKSPALLFCVTPGPNAWQTFIRPPSV